MNRFLILTLLFSNVAFSAECNKAIMSIFEEDNINQFIDSNTEKDRKAGSKCLNQIGVDITSESYCDCINSNPKADFDSSRKLYRKKLGIKVKSTIFSFVNEFQSYQEQANENNVNIYLSCGFNDTIEKYCDREFISEIFNHNNLDNLSNEFKYEYFEVYQNNLSGTISRYRMSSCLPIDALERESTPLNSDDYKNKDEWKEDLQNKVNTRCDDFSKTIEMTCKSDALTLNEKDFFEFDALSQPDRVDDYNYYCKIFDEDEKKIIYSTVLKRLKRANEKRNQEPPKYCQEICRDKAPYSFLGCQLDHGKAKAVLDKYNCKEDKTSDNCIAIMGLLAKDVKEQLKNNKLTKEEVTYLKDYLDEENFEEVMAINATALSSTTPTEDSFVNQFFDSGEGKKETEAVVQNTPEPQTEVSAPSEEQTQAHAQANTPQSAGQAQVTQQPNQGTQQNLAANNSSTLTMGSRGRGRGKVSARTKQMVETIKTLREAGSSLKDAIAAQDRRMKREREELARSNREKYQRYDAETLEPITRSPSSDDRRRRGSDRQLANVGSPSSGSGGNNGMATGAGGSGGTGSSTFLPPEKKATVVDITGRSAPELDLNNLQSSGATLPASITNHPDASEISKMFNGLEYKKDSGRGPASDNGDIKKIKVDWSASSIDLGSLLINAKDIKPGEEFILYKGDMDQYVRLVPSYTFRGGKKVFVGYRIENRSSENADLAASIFAKKFLIL